MMLILRDDQVLELFESPSEPPNWIEAIDVKNEEYSFCDDQGQRFIGVITKPSGWFKTTAFELRPVGEPDVANALALIDQARSLEPNNWFSDLCSFRQHLTHHSSGTR